MSPSCWIEVPTYPSRVQTPSLFLYTLGSLLGVDIFESDMIDMICLILLTTAAKSRGACIHFIAQDL